MSFLENFVSSSSGGDLTITEGTGWKTAAQAAPAVLAGFQAIKAQIDYGNKITEIDNLMKNRQQLNNPYANMSNPFANLSVATEAARFQAEQTDIALANTLDNLRETGAGGATALAQAALQSKKGVSANIQQQEARNQRLQAQGQQRVDLAKAQGTLQVMGMQEQRDARDLDMLQDQADLLKAQQIYSTQSAMSSLGTAAETLAGGIVPAKLPTTTEGAENDLSLLEDEIQVDVEDEEINPQTGLPYSAGYIENLNVPTQRRSDPRVPGAKYLSQFYSGIGESLGNTSSRAPLYEQLGLGSASSYIGSPDQNRAFLEELQYGNYEL